MVPDDDSSRPAELAKVATTLGAPDSSEFRHLAADIEQFQRGDPAAFDRIWRLLQPAVELIIASRIRSKLEPDLRARMDAADILQVVAAKVAEKLGTFEYRGPGAMLAWLTTIAQHAAGDMIDYWRAEIRDPKRERRLESGRGTQGTKTPGLPAPGPGPVTDASRAELRRTIGAALDKLSERHRNIVMLKFFAGATWEEIAAEVGSPSGAAVMMEFRGRVLPRLARSLNGSVD